MGIQDYLDTLAPAPEALRKIWAQAKRHGLDKLTMREIDAEVAATRRARLRQKPERQPQK